MTDGLRALTIKQPWAHMITRCGKNVENRSWPTPSWLGELAIHAGARSGWDEDGEHSPLVREAWYEWHKTLPPMNVAGPIRRESLLIDFSAIVAVAGGVTCHHAEECMRPEWSEPPLSGCAPGWCVRDQYHWTWESLHVLPEPVPCRGYQKLWTVPEDVESAVRAQIKASDA